ncbi:MAG: Type I transmembrane sorting receptor [Icmadophila ericetorum]|nr:Type I transmembrane sorting receptor [Icmadophila ericetorum]
MSGQKAMLKVYKKYGKSIPARIKAGTSSNGSVTATPSKGDQEYDAQVVIGGQTFNLDFDTGSSDLWVYSTELDPTSQAGHSVYNPANSTTSEQIDDATWSITYGDASTASGDVYTDTVTIGGVTVAKQAVELASNVSTEFLSDFSNDGLVGLAFDNLNNVQPNPVKTFFTNLAPTLSLPLFTANLNHKTPGSYDFGFIDPSKYTGSLTTLPADSSKGFWGINCTGYQIGGDGTALKNITVDGIVDTGTTLLLVPQQYVDGYYAQVPGAKNDPSSGGYIFPCSTQLPTLHLGFGDYVAHITSALLNFGPLDSNNPSGSCFGSFQTLNLPGGVAGSPSAIFGDVFLKSTFVVFTAPPNGTATLGFAQKVSATDPSGSGNGGGWTSLVAIIRAILGKTINF